MTTPVFGVLQEIDLGHLSEVIVGIVLMLLVFLVMKFAIVPAFEKMYEERSSKIEGGMQRAREAFAEIQEARRLDARLTVARNDPDLPGGPVPSGTRLAVDRSVLTEAEAFVQHQGNVGLVRIAKDFDVERRELTQRLAEERAKLWPRLVDMYADFTDYQRRTDRTIPVIRLSPR